MARTSFMSLRKEIVEICRLFYERGWSPATSGNYSVRLDAKRILITTSRKDKGLIAAKDIVLVDLAGKPLNSRSLQPSAETLLHCSLYESNPEMGAILHTHSKYATLLSMRTADQITLEGYEMLKALRGVHTHEHRETLPVFPNHQDMNTLAQIIKPYLRKNPQTHAFLILAHGLYTWGRDLAEAKRHVEALEFLLECEYHRSS